MPEISNSMIILDGKKLSEEILENLKKEIKKRNLKLRLSVVQVGENPVSKIFISQKKKACERVGINFKLCKLPAKISVAELKKEIERIVKEPENSGVIIQLPLSKKFLPEELLNLISLKKDIDVLSEKSLGKFYQGTLSILPPTVQGILYLFKNYKIELKGKNVVIVGAGRLIGNPLALRLLREKATISVLNEFTKDTPSFTKKADILISGVGKPNLITGKMVKKGVVVIDAGTSIKKGRLVGDVDFKSVSKKASYITPVPGGVGPMTVACLIENLVKLNV
ncbi:MAG: bifunctional 5,10-methylenetetrahydrofolate dehydrogenase/5,10-methenyltetrahydrofolate cyclohydrolase [bacterium]|nr:bifunctional 5,10-methylenetetrahydrofolate dehydrogenase/5,10-methenyltetrahydrofolate cyclohydrolase [bacterium]